MSLVRHQGRRGRALLIQLLKDHQPPAAAHAVEAMLTRKKIDIAALEPAAALA